MFVQDRKYMRTNNASLFNVLRERLSTTTRVVLLQKKEGTRYYTDILAVTNLNLTKSPGKGSRDVCRYTINPLFLLLLF